MVQEMARENASLPNPEQIAQRVLARAGRYKPPIKPDRLVAAWDNLRVVEEELDGSGYLLPLGKLGAEIVVNKSESPERQRFTIAHELGHWVLGLIWEKKFGTFQQPGGVPPAQIEKWCDSFATNLLMPRELMEPWLAGCDKPSFIHMLARARDDFEVSEQALFLRVWELSRIQVVKLKPRCSPNGGTEFALDHNYGDDASRVYVEDLLRMPDVQMNIKIADPLVFFSGVVRGRPVHCSGLKLSAGRVLLSLGRVPRLSRPMR